jgi:hypothetical protein
MPGRLRLTWSKLARGTEGKRHRHRYRQVFHLVGQDRRGALVLRQKWSRGQVELVLTRYTDPEPELRLLLDKLRLELPAQPPPRITVVALDRPVPM